MSKIRCNYLKISVFVILFNLISGCTTNNLNSLPINKISLTEENNNIVDLGFKNNTGVKTSFSFNKKNPDFVIKSITNGFNSYSSLDCVLVKINDETGISPLEDAGTRFVSTTEKSFKLIVNPVDGWDSVQSITFQGLKPGTLTSPTKYYASARAYKSIHIPLDNSFVLDYSIMKLKITASSEPAINKGDIIKISDSSVNYYFEITSSASGTGTFYYSIRNIYPNPATFTSISNTSINLEWLTSAVNDGNIPTQSNGGGTASGYQYTNSGTKEEYISVSDKGALEIINDDSPPVGGGSVPLSTASGIKNLSWDIPIKLQDSVYPSVTGTISINPGS